MATMKTMKTETKAAKKDNVDFLYHEAAPSKEKEQARDRLLAHPDLRLLYVSNQDSKMMIVRPAVDVDHRENIKRMGGFFALSHLWGNVEDHPFWDLGDVVKETEENLPADPIPMRPEKRGVLLALLKAYPGYWWVDVLCARVTTPLVIMRFIYAYCTTCFAMIDCSPTIIKSLCDHHLMPISKQLYHHAQQFIDDTLDNTRFKDLINASDGDQRSVLDYAICRKRMQNMLEFLGCRWFDRVWTMQEMTLPARLVILSETCDPHKVALSTSHVNLKSVVQFGHLLKSIYMTMDNDDLANRLISEIYEKTKMIATSDTIHHLSRPRDPEARAVECMQILSTFKQSTRRCTDQRDYIYGVLGLLGLHIPRIDDPIALWRLFLFEIQIMFSWTQHPPHSLLYHANPSFNLDTASNLGDIYTALFGSNTLETLIR
ncbi:predicted protein [Lichtheimia corymbifera JMRC:FSU:9682]|uniref:Heterokaryon incompatibility domain-containing protein n=1 Tax=Lichtheimia corymbifera JMRC:FSU:9682 TaxID=1263082 RepID=A0A068S6W8_9FUNG|nr:predicted protein [Lichtheimia corymbifera JMRC:FSU:9682]